MDLIGKNKTYRLYISDGLSYGLQRWMNVNIDLRITQPNLKNMNAKLDYKFQKMDLHCQTGRSNHPVRSNRKQGYEKKKKGNQSKNEL